MASGTTIDLIVNQRASFQVFFNVKESNGSILDLTDYSVAAKFKENYQMSDSQATAFIAEVSNTSAGEVSIALTPDQTSQMQVGKYVYDVAITNNLDDYKIRIVEGKITVSGGVT